MYKRQEFTVNGDVTTLYLISLEDPQDVPKELFTNREEVSTSSVNLDEIRKPFVMHVSEDWVFYDIQSGPADNRTNALYGYQIETGETKMLVEDGFSVAGDLSPVEDTLYWYDTDGATYGTLNRIDLEGGEIATVCEIPVSELSLIHI